MADLPEQQDNVSEQSALLKTRYPRIKTRMKNRRGHKSRSITSNQGVVRYPKRKMR